MQHSCYYISASYYYFSSYENKNLNCYFLLLKKKFLILKICKFTNSIVRHISVIGIFLLVTYKKGISFLRKIFQFICTFSSKVLKPFLYHLLVSLLFSLLFSLSLLTACLAARDLARRGNCSSFASVSYSTSPILSAHLSANRVCFSKKTLQIESTKLSIRQIPKPALSKLSTKRPIIQSNLNNLKETAEFFDKVPNVISIAKDCCFNTFFSDECREISKALLIGLKENVTNASNLQLLQLSVAQGELQLNKTLMEMKLNAESAQFKAQEVASRVKIAEGEIQLNKTLMDMKLNAESAKLNAESAQFKAQEVASRVKIAEGEIQLSKPLMDMKLQAQEAQCRLQIAESEHRIAQLKKLQQVEEAEAAEFALKKLQFQIEVKNLLDEQKAKKPIDILPENTNLTEKNLDI